jgi:hypothetical protein
MYDETLLLEKLEQINEALAKIERRFASIGSPDDFLDSDCGLDMLDGIAMMLIAIGENFKKIDKETGGKLLASRTSTSILMPRRFSISATQISSLCAMQCGK